jgi:predicted O-methyltransferase YrrM
MADNAFAFGRLFDEKAGEGVAAIREFNEVVAATPELQGIIVPVGDGLWVAAKRPVSGKP